jgi:hypothetical protein
MMVLRSQAFDVAASSPAPPRQSSFKAVHAVSSATVSLAWAAIGSPKASASAAAASKRFMVGLSFDLIRLRLTERRVFADAFRSLLDAFVGRLNGLNGDAAHALASSPTIVVEDRMVVLVDVDGPTTIGL